MHVPSMTINCIWWWDSSSGALGKCRKPPSLPLLSCSLWPGVVISSTTASQRHNNKDAGRLLYKYMYRSLYCKGLKRVTQGLRVRGSWWPNINCNILTPHSYGHQCCVFLVLLMLNWRPWAHSAGWWLSLLHHISNFSGPQTTLGFPRVPLAGCGFLYNSVSNCNCNCHLTSVLTELYNSSTSIRSPTRSLEWHDWSSSSRNNCHAVHRSLSSGASVYECIMGFLPFPISSAKSTHAISFDYWPLECVTSFRCITL